MERYSEGTAEGKADLSLFLLHVLFLFLVVDSGFRFWLNISLMLPLCADQTLCKRVSIFSLPCALASKDLGCQRAIAPLSSSVLSLHYRPYSLHSVCVCVYVTSYSGEWNFLEAGSHELGVLNSFPVEFAVDVSGHVGQDRSAIFQIELAPSTWVSKYELCGESTSNPW